MLSVDLHLPTSAQVREFVDLAAPLGTIISIMVVTSRDFNAASLKQLMRIKSLRRLNLGLGQADFLKGTDLEMLSELPTSRTSDLATQSQPTMTRSRL